MYVKTTMKYQSTPILMANIGGGGELTVINAGWPEWIATETLIYC